jgi:hypothetical protein
MSDSRRKMVEGSRARYLIRCGAKLSSGAQCTNLIGLLLDEKTVCPACGAVHAPWSDYAYSRTKVGDAALCVPVDSLLAAPLS